MRTERRERGTRADSTQSTKPGAGPHPTPKIKTRAEAEHWPRDPLCHPGAPILILVQSDPLWTSDLQNLMNVRWFKPLICGN